MIKEIATAHTRLAMTGCGLCKALAFKMIQGRLLKITYKAEENEIIVITAMVKGV